MSVSNVSHSTNAITTQSLQKTSLASDPEVAAIVSETIKKVVALAVKNAEETNNKQAAQTVPSSSLDTFIETVKKDVDAGKKVYFCLVDGKLEHSEDSSKRAAITDLFAHITDHFAEIQQPENCDLLQGKCKEFAQVADSKLTWYTRPFFPDPMATCDTLCKKIGAHKAALLTRN